MTIDNDFSLDAPPAEAGPTDTTDDLNQGIEDFGHAAHEGRPGASDANDAGDDGRRGGPRGTNVKQIAKRSIEKYLEVSAAPDTDRRAAALVLGSPSRADAADITVAVISAQRANLRLLDRTDAIAEADDPFDAMSVVMTLHPADIRRTWDLLVELDVVEGRWPAGVAVAAKAIARAVHADRDAVLAGTGRIRALVRK